MINTNVENIANAICAWLKYSETQLSAKAEIWDVKNSKLTDLLKAFIGNYSKISKSLEQFYYLIAVEAVLRFYLAGKTPSITEGERWNTQLMLFNALVECELYLGKTICTNSASLKDIKSKAAH